MTNDFYTNLTTITNNLEDIAFTKYATIININNDGTCTAKEDEEEGLTHENINTLGNNLRVGDKVVLGFVDNSIYNPVILTGGEEAYTKTETDALLQKKINEPLNEGTNGQVLTTDGQGGRTWKTVQGGGTGVDIATSWGNPTSDSKVPSEKLAKDSLDAKADTGHTHTISNVTNLQTTLDGKASSTHTHTISDVTNLQTTLDGKASSSHSHSISDVTNLQSSLNAKANSSDLGTVATSNSYDDLDDIPSSFTPSSHTHAISEVTNLQTSLDAKAPKSHASSATTYGVGTTANYGHCKTVNSLTQSSHSNGLALSAYQGYVLKGLIDDLNDLIGDAITYINQ